MIRIVNLHPLQVEEHELRINSFIPNAKWHADHTVFRSGEVNGIKRLYSVEEYRARWSQAYLAKMNELTMAAGLRVPFFS